MHIKHLTHKDYSRQPWKNGGGITLEIAREDLEHRMLWRVSLANVSSSGPFSDFTGYRRTIMLLSGEGMVLRAAGDVEVRLDRPHLPYEFDGSLAVDCQLIDGPVEDFNLIVDAAHAKGTLGVLDIDATPTTIRIAHDVLLLFVLSGMLKVYAAGQTFNLGEREMLRMDHKDQRLEGACLSVLAGGGRVQLARVGIDLHRPI